MKTIIDQSSALSEAPMSTRVIVDGVDVSSRCTAALKFSDGTVEAYCLKLRDGRPFADECGDVTRERIVGPGNIIRATENVECNCPKCHPNFKTRGVTAFIDSHHWNGSGWEYIGA